MEEPICKQINAIMNGINEIYGQGLSSCTVRGNWILLRKENKEEKLEITCELRQREKMDWMYFVSNTLPYDWRDSNYRSLLL